jgi:hypothetical protein
VTTRGWINELTRGWCNERTARGNATTSWRDKTTRGQRNERTARGDVTTSWCGASQCGAQSNVFNPTLRLFSHTCLHISRTRLHTTSDENQMSRHKKHKQQTNTTTMVVEPLAPPAAWI